MFVYISFNLLIKTQTLIRVNRKGIVHLFYFAIQSIVYYYGMDWETLIELFQNDSQGIAFHS